MSFSGELRDWLLLALWVVLWLRVRALEGRVHRGGYQPIASGEGPGVPPHGQGGSARRPPPYRHRYPHPKDN